MSQDLTIIGSEEWCEIESLGIPAIKARIDSGAKTSSIQATKILNLDVAGVDIIRSSRGPLLLEVNSSPGLEGVENATGIDVAKTIIIAIEKKLSIRYV